MMKKWTTIAVSLLAVVLLIGCGGKYADVKKANEDYVDIVENYVAALDEAEDSKDVVKAMDAFSEDLEKLWPKMQELSEKYPELENEENLPEELKESQERAEEIGKKMATSMMKLMQYMNDPEVREAQQRMGQIMMQQ